MPIAKLTKLKGNPGRIANEKPPEVIIVVIMMFLHR